MLNTVEAVRAHLKKLAEQYTPPPRSRSQALLEPFADSIRELRERGASFSMITLILKGANIEVSRFAVGRFCRDHLGVIRKVRKRRGPYKRTERAVEATVSTHTKPVVTPTPSKLGDLPDGPRIVDLNNL